MTENWDHSLTEGWPTTTVEAHNARQDALTTWLHLSEDEKLARLPREEWNAEVGRLLSALLRGAPAMMFQRG